MSATKPGISRRQVLMGAGAVTAAFGAINFNASRAYATGKWDHEADIIVVGSGIGAATAAFVAHKKGNSVKIIEKSEYFGGTSAKSAGVLWIPNNFTLKVKGIDDNKEDCLRYIARYSYPENYNPDVPFLGLDQAAYALLEAFYDNASDAVDFLRNNDALKLAEWRMFALDRSATDYLDNVPENKVPMGRALGVELPDGSTGLGAHLMEQLKNALDINRIPVFYKHRAMRLVLNDYDRVVGLESDHDNKVVTLRANKAVIFATGGYVHNPQALLHYQRNTLYGSCARPTSTGDFIDIAGAAGARLGNMSGAWRTQILLEEALENRVLSSGVFYPPGDSMFQVNKYGVRVVNENRNYNDRTEVHGIYNPSKAEFPNQLLFMIYDQRTAEAFAGVYPLPAKPLGARHVLSGESLEELTGQITNRLQQIAPHTGGYSLDPSFTGNLKKTMFRFNAFARSGEDEDFARGEAAYDSEWFMVFSPMRQDTDWPENKGPSITMHPFRDKGPYYAIILAGGALDTNGGPVIDARARVLDTFDKPISGLYGAGNCIASPSREAYWGAGHTLALSLTYGYIAANEAHREQFNAA